MDKVEVRNIIMKIKEGNPSGFDVLYDKFSPALYGVCLKILRDPIIAEDALQESFSKVWKNIDSYDESKGTLFTWLLNITRNSAIDQLRTLKKTPSFEAENEASFLKKEEGNTNNIKTNHIGLGDLVETLPKNEKLIIDYLFYKGYTQQEVAEELDIPLGTVKSRSRKALGSLKKMFSIFITWI